MERGARGTRRDTYSTYWTDSLQEASGRTVDSRDLLVGAAMARLPPASSPARLTSAGIRSTKLCPNSYKTTKGEGISRKLKIESTNNKRYIKESTHEK
jgi:hypothetical protein